MGIALFVRAVSRLSALALSLMLVAFGCEIGGGTSGDNCDVPTEAQGVFQTPQGSFVASYGVVNGDALIGGDMLLPLRSYDYAAATPTVSALWLNNRIPYEIPAAFPQRQLAENAINSWNALKVQTGVEFVPRTNETDYITFEESTEGCRSYVGRRGGVQVVEMHPDPSRCPQEAYLHEVGHVLGLAHEHQRPDRDNYITVHYDRLRSGIESQWERMSGLRTITGYDIGSLMHYGAGAGASTCTVAASTNRRICDPVIVPKNPGIATNRVGGKTIQPSDIAGVADLYGGTGPVGGVPPLPGDGTTGSCYF
jgi:hypothetical protein